MLLSKNCRISTRRSASAILRARLTRGGQVEPPFPSEVQWEVDAPSYASYERSFDIVKNNMLMGNSYLANLTCNVPVRCNLSLHDIFLHAKGKYKLLLRGREEGNRHFVCFSPETFVKVKVTDSSYTNLALFDGHEWLMPRRPLLQGTKRAFLLDQGLLKEADLTLADLRRAQRVSLFNAMIDMGERVVEACDIAFE